MSNIYGMSYNPYGSLPYGNNPFSQSSVINTGGLWRDDNTVWNLSDPIVVQNLRETGSVMRGMGLQYNGMYSPAMGGNFYDSLIQRQSAQMGMLQYNTSSSGSNGDMFTQMFQMMLIMKQLDAVDKVKKEKDKPEVKEKEFKSTELSDFIENQNKASVLKYGDINEFSKDQLAKLKETKDNDISHALELVGIDFKEMTPKAKKALFDEMAKGNPKVEGKYEEFKDQMGTLSIDNPENLKKLFVAVGLKEDETSITREELNKNALKLTKTGQGEHTETEEKKTKAAEERMSELKDVLNKSEPTTSDRETVKSIAKEAAKDPEKLKALLAAIKDEHVRNGQKGTTNVLSSMFTTLASDDDEQGIADFEDVLKGLKKAAKEHKLGNEWNEAVASAEGEKEKMNKSFSFFGSSQKKKTLNDILADAHID